MGRDDSGHRPGIADVRGLSGRSVGLLNRRILIRMPEGGFGVTSDAVFLASAMPVSSGMRVLDAGCGVGSAGLCLAVRVAGLDAHGLEIDPELAEFARQNGAGNGIGRWTVHAGDLFGPLPPALTAGFDCVGTNPPWQRSDGSTPSPDPRRALARREGGRGRALHDWLAACARLVRANGTLVAIIPFERIDDGLARLDGWVVEVQPLCAHAGSPPRTALLRFRRSAAPWRRDHPPFTLHSGEGHSPAADRILRGGEAFPWPVAGDLHRGPGLVHNPV